MQSAAAGAAAAAAAPAGYDIYFYVVAWGLASISGILVTFTRGEHRDGWDLVAIGCLSGLTSVGVLGIVCRVAGGTYGNEPYYLGLAILVGLLGKRGLKFSQWIVSSILNKLGYTDERRRPPPNIESDEPGDH